MSLASIITTAVNPWAKWKWAAIALVVVLWHIAYGAFWSRHGRLGVQHEWDSAKAKANSEARSLEQQRQRRADEAAQLASARENRLRLSAARNRSLSDGLRGDLDAARQFAKESRAAAERTADLATELLGRCEQSYLGVAEAAARADSEARELRQAWPK